MTAWMPIETAPRQFWPPLSHYNHHSPRILLWCGGIYREVIGQWGAMKGYLNEGRWEFAGRNEPIPKDHQPTHWQPLPAPPSP